MAESILKEFYYGNVVPVERQIINISEIRRAAKELDMVENQLRAILQPEAIPLMERYGKVQAELARSRKRTLTLMASKLVHGSCWKYLMILLKA